MPKKTKAKNRFPKIKTLYLKTILPYCTLLLAVLIYFWGILTNRNFLWGDMLDQYLPFHYFLFKNLRQLHIPAWNPYMFAGMPFLADIQTQVFYPFSWLGALISNQNLSRVFYLIELSAIIHILLAGIGFYLLMRELKFSIYTGVISGLTFAFSSFMILHTFHLTIVCTFAWFPLLLLYFYRMLFHRRITDAVIAGMMLGLANLAGHPQMSTYMVYAVGLLFVVYIIFNWQAERGFLLKNHLPLFATMIISGITLAAAAYLPAYRFSLHTVRELMTYKEAAEISLPPTFLVALFIPKFFGSISGTGTDSVEFWLNQEHYYWETAVYVGVAPTILALIGIISSKHKLRWHFVILAIISLILALGKYTPVYTLAFKFLPGFDRFRVPARLMGIFISAMAFLTGLGMEVFISTRNSRRNLFLPGLFTLGYGIIILLLLTTGPIRSIFPMLNSRENYNNALNQTTIFITLTLLSLLIIWLRRKYQRATVVLAGILIILTFLDLYQFGNKFIRGEISPEQFYPKRDFTDHLIAESKKTPFRINARLGQYMILQRNEGLIWELELLEGYTPLKLTDYVTFDIPTERKNDLLNAKYRIYLDTVKQIIGLLPNLTVLPRLWLVDSFVVVNQRDEILRILSQPEFNPQRVALLEKPPPFPIRPDHSTQNLRTIDIVKRTPELWKIKVKNSAPALLIISEVFYPEWKAVLDTRPVELLRANYCLRALPLPAGDHYVTFYYDRKWINLGITISLFSLAMIITVLIIRKNNIKRENKQPPPHSPTTKVYQ